MAVLDPDEIPEIGNVPDSSFETTVESEPDSLALLKNSDMNATSTINPERPRTWAAGYSWDEEKQLGTMTVVFRDDKGGTGVWWNYYDVPYPMWEAFRSAESKGRYLRSSGMDWWSNMGPADTESVGGFKMGQLNAIVMGARRRQAMTGGKVDQGKAMKMNFKGFGNAY
jgi:hypothetical protein